MFGSQLVQEGKKSKDSREGGAKLGCFQHEVGYEILRVGTLLPL